MIFDHLRQPTDLPRGLPPLGRLVADARDQDRAELAGAVAAARRIVVTEGVRDFAGATVRDRLALLPAVMALPRSPLLSGGSVWVEHRARGGAAAAWEQAVGRGGPETPTIERLGVLAERMDGNTVRLRWGWSHPNRPPVVGGYLALLDASPARALESSLRAAAALAPPSLRAMASPIRDATGTLADAVAATLPPRRVSLAEVAEVAQRVHTLPTPQTSAMLFEVSQHDPAGAARVAQLLAGDIVGETLNAVSLLVTLASRNVVTFRHERRDEALVKARRRRGLDALDYEIAHLAPRMHDVGGHVVGGHWKVRSSGIFWWAPHARRSHRRGGRDAA